MEVDVEMKPIVVPKLAYFFGDIYGVVLKQVVELAVEVPEVCRRHARSRLDPRKVKGARWTEINVVPPDDEVIISGTIRKRAKTVSELGQFNEPRVICKRKVFNIVAVCFAHNFLQEFPAASALPSAQETV
jgi:hypothetical protein